MSALDVFTTLCDLTDQLLAQSRALEPGAAQDGLLHLVTEFDQLIDALVGYELTPMFPREENPES